MATGIETEKELIIRAAWYYYIQKKTQKDIAEKLNISRMLVLRLLEKAEQEGVIQIKIKNKHSDRLEIEQQLIQKTGLKDAFVIPDPESQDPNQFTDTLAHAGALYIDEYFADNPVINVGYGDTTGRVMNHFAQMSEKRPTYVSLTGGVSIYLLNTKALLSSANLYLIPAPFKASTKEMVQAISSEAAVIEIAQMHKNAACTIIGIGGMNDDATVIKSGIIPKTDFDFLKIRGAVGDVLAHFFDKDGTPIITTAEEHLISYSLEKLEGLNNVIAIAGGKKKYEAIRAAVKARYCNILVTNESTADWLIHSI